MCRAPLDGFKHSSERLAFWEKSQSVRRGALTTVPTGSEGWSMVGILFAVFIDATRIVALPAVGCDRASRLLDGRWSLISDPRCLTIGAHTMSRHGDLTTNPMRGGNSPRPLDDRGGAGYTVS